MDIQLTTDYFARDFTCVFPILDMGRWWSWRWWRWRWRWWRWLRWWRRGFGFDFSFGCGCWSSPLTYFFLEGWVQKPTRTFVNHTALPYSESNPNFSWGPRSHSPGIRQRSRNLRCAAADVQGAALEAERVRHLAGGGKDTALGPGDDG